MEKVDCVEKKAIGGGQEIWLTPLFGMSETKPLEGWPCGKVRIRTRNAGYASGFVRAGNGTTRHFLVHDDGEHWIPCHEQGANSPQIDIGVGVQRTHPPAIKKRHPPTPQQKAQTTADGTRAGSGVDHAMQQGSTTQSWAMVDW